MSSPTELFLEVNDIDHRWKVLDSEDKPYGDGASPKDAIMSARTVTNAPICIGVGMYVKDKADYTADELITELAKLAGMSIIEIYDEGLNLVGYNMEVKE